MEPTQFFQYFACLVTMITFTINHCRIMADKGLKNCTILDWGIMYFLGLLIGLYIGIYIGMWYA